MRLITSITLAMAISNCVFGQTFTIKTVAGGKLPENIPGVSASLGRVAGIATDSANNVYIPLPDYNIVVKLDTQGNLTRVAGTGLAGSLGDNGAATGAQLTAPTQVALDSAGNLYIADQSRIRKVTGGVIATVAGGGTDASDNISALNAQLGQVGGLAVDIAGAVYFSDSLGNRVRKVAGGVVSTIAGTGTGGYNNDNIPATAARLNSPQGLAVDTAGSLYIADSLNNRIRKVSSSLISTFAGNGSAGSGGDNFPAIDATLNAPVGLALDTAGSLYIVDAGNNRVRRVSNGVISAVAGTGTVGFVGDGGPAVAAQMYGPAGVAADGLGGVYITEAQTFRIRKVFSGLIGTAAGGGAAVGDTGDPAAAQLSGPWAVALDAFGAVYIADSRNHRVRKVLGGTIITVAGNGTQGTGLDNIAATSAQLNQPGGVAVDGAGSIYIADTGNHRVRKVSNGVIATIAGTGVAGYNGDNISAAGAQLSSPTGLAVDSQGNLYIADAGNNLVRKISNGTITTFAGARAGGSAADGIPATGAQLNGPSALALDASGNLYVADTLNNRVRKISAGIITTVAGNGSAVYGGDFGAATSAGLGNPAGVGVDSAGAVYISDNLNQRIRRVASGVITTVAGNGVTGFAGDNGLATSAQLNGPRGMAVDGSGNIYFADTGNQRLRLLARSGAACTYSISSSSLVFGASGGSLSIGIQTDVSCPWSVGALPAWAMVSGASSGTGPATVTLLAPANPGTQRTATTSLAGLSIALTQQGSGVCTYAISPGGQAWGAAGGTGTINVTTAAGCSWTAASTPNWVIITGALAATGSGSVTYQVSPNTGGPRSGAMTIAGLFFNVEQASGTVTGLNFAGSMAQLVSGGTWKTTITLINAGAAPAQARLNFYDDNGAPLTLPWRFTQNSTGDATVASTLDRTIAPGAALVMESTGPDELPALAGSVQLLTSGNISGFAVLRQAVTNPQEAVVPLEGRNPAGFLLWFDNSGGYSTGVALANVSTQVASVGLVIRDDTGTVVLSDAISLNPQGHTAFDLAGRYSATVQRRGTLEFQTPAGGQISVLGIRFSPNTAFTTIPPLAK